MFGLGDVVEVKQGRFSRFLFGIFQRHYYWDRKGDLSLDRIGKKKTFAFLYHIWYSYINEVGEKSPTSHIGLPKITTLIWSQEYHVTQICFLNYVWLLFGGQFWGNPQPLPRLLLHLTLGLWSSPSWIFGTTLRSIWKNMSKKCNYALDLNNLDAWRSRKSKKSLESTPWRRLTSHLI